MTETPAPTSPAAKSFASAMSEAAQAPMNEERLQEISLRMQQPGFAVPCVQQDICALMAEVRRLQREAPQREALQMDITPQERAAEARAEKAERERDVLARYATRCTVADGDYCPADFGRCPHGFNIARVDENGIPRIPCGRASIEDIKDCWLAWAAQEAAKEPAGEDVCGK